MKYLPIQGTHAWREKGEWWQPDSPFVSSMRDCGHELLSPEQPFVWSTDLNGISLRSLFGVRASHNDWRAGGHALTYYLRAIPFDDRNLIAHSHGLQVVLYAAATRSVAIRSVIAIASPERADMDEVAQQGRPSIDRWVHVCDPRADWVAWLGQITDGRWFGSRRCEHADVVLELPGVSHSGLLRDQKHFHHWPETILPALDR